MDQITNKIALTPELVVELRSYQRRIRESTVQMALRAWEIRRQYISADGRKYDAEFENWWSNNKLDSVFGARANFTKWASAGEALENARFDKYSDKMPSTLTALYEISQLTDDEVRLCLQDKYTRTSLTDEPKGSKKPSPLIHPEATAVEIKNWRKRWRNPKAKSTERRYLQFATIKVDFSFYDFLGETKKGGVVLTPETLKEINDSFLNAMKPFGEYIHVETDLEKLLEGHKKRQEKAEAQAEKARKAAEKKAAEKKTKKSSR